MDKEIKKFRKQLEKAERRTKEAEKRALEEQHRREGAEKAARASQPLAIEPYFDAYHSLNLAIQIFTDRSLTTQGDTTNPAGRVYPDEYPNGTNLQQNKRKYGICCPTLPSPPVIYFHLDTRWITFAF